MQHLKASLWHTVSNILEEEIQKLKVQYTPNFLAGLVQLVFDQLVSVSEDLNSFSHHANRKTIIPSDLFMIVRKNSQLLETMKDTLEELKNKNNISSSVNSNANGKVPKDNLKESVEIKPNNQVTGINAHILESNTDENNDRDANINDKFDDDDDFDDNFDFTEIDKKLKQ